MARSTRNAPSNAELARHLHEIALRLEMDRVQFKPKAYRRAARAIEECDDAIAAAYDREGKAALIAIPGVGAGIAARLEELLRTGEIADLERMRTRAPGDVLALGNLPGLGARKIRTLQDKLGVRTLADLEEACRTGRVAALGASGGRLQDQVMRALRSVAEAGHRHLRSRAQPFAEAFRARLARLDGVKDAAIAGALRRGEETVADLAFVLAATDPAAALSQVGALSQVAEILETGATQVRVRLANGMEADVAAAPRESFGAAMVQLTGSAAHLERLRALAAKRGMHLREGGLFSHARGRRRIATPDEADVYGALDLPFIEPELREDSGEIEAAQKGALPRLIEPGSLRGDLQVQTDWTDGAASIEDMVAAAKAAGFEYVAITDHTQDLAMTNGLDEDRLLQQMRVVRALDATQRGFRVLAGAEVNIREDGTLDIEDRVLKQLDFVGAAIHSHLKLPRDAMTKRLVRTIENPHVDAIFHPSERRIGHREPVDFDVDAIIAAAKRTGTVLEVDAQPDRLDLKPEHVRKAVEAGVKLVIDSDAHHVRHFDFPERHGVPIARRGWATAADVLNTRSVKECLAGLKDARRR